MGILNEKIKALKALAEKGKERLKKVSKKVYFIVAAVLAVILVAVAAAVSSQPYSVLFAELSSSELSSIVTYLEGQGVSDYKIENGDTILVPKGQEASLTAKLLMEEYPQTGFTYSYDTYYNHVGSLSTESERRTTFLHDLQDQMSATVRCFDNVKNATVNIALGEDNSYILDKSATTQASASVLVEMNGSAKLTNDQAAAIRRYIAHAVQGLTISDVSIEDTLGNRYGTSDSIADADASALKIQLEQEWENKIRTEVMQVLLPFYGADNVAVGVNCTVDVSQRTVSSRDVSLPEGSANGEGIKGEKIYEYYVKREDDETAGGTVGSETNSDLADVPEYVEKDAVPNGTEKELGGSGTVIYDNPYEETVAIYTAGYLTDCSVSVSINETQAGTVDAQEVREHVARVAGIRGIVDEETGKEYLDDKISVVIRPFYSEPALIPAPSQWPVETWVVYAAAIGLLVFLVLLIVILRIRRKKRKQKKAEQQRQKELDEILAAAGLARSNAPAEGADVMTLQTERSMELRKDIRQFSDDNPEIAAQMLRGWLRGGEDND